MIKPKIPEDEELRLETLRALKLLDSAPEERFDRLTRMAKRMFGVSTSLVSLVDKDRQWFKSAEGLDASETPRDISFCGHAILDDQLFLIPNALSDERFADNPLVTGDPNIRFYAGCPLKMPNGHTVGTLCLIDSKPRELSEEDQRLLQDLGIMAEQEVSALKLATIDELTMISNRRGFSTLARFALNMCRRSKMPAAVVFMDLDNFKPINDNFGHAEGDRALIAFANIIREEMRNSDVFARLGGDEFVALYTDVDEQKIQAALVRLQQAVNKYNARANRGYDLHFSAGFALKGAEEDIPLNTLVQRADEHMLKLKADKRDASAIER